MSKTSTRAIEEALKVNLVNRLHLETWDNRVKLTTRTPILHQPLDEIHLENAVFPVRPFPNSRLSTLEPDGQINRIYEKKTWAEGFLRHRCIVPMSSFFEPVYWGEAAGTWLEFSLPENELIFAAGIRIKPQQPATGRLDGFSLLTHTASAQMLEYHHRLIVLLRAADALNWLSAPDDSARAPQEIVREKFNQLVQNRFVPEFNVTHSSDLGKGWQKRVDSHTEALNEEIEYREALASEGVLA